jgi:hypothetical protein
VDTAATCDVAALQTYAREVSALNGDLTYLRTRTQREVDALWRAMPGISTFYLDCTRRFGKTTVGALTCYEQQRAAVKRGLPAIMRYCAPSKLHGRTFVIPAFDWVARRVPAEMRPRFDVLNTCWRWPDGSVCYLGSAESMGDIEAQVGTDCDVAVVDEAGKWSMGLLGHWITSVITSQFMTRKWGKILVASTPPLTPAHDLTPLRKKSISDGFYAKYTIDDLDHIDEETKAAVIKAVYEGIDGGEGGITAVLRELFCEHVTEDTMAIIPEMRHVKDEAVARVIERMVARYPMLTSMAERLSASKGTIIEELERPEHFDCYVVADFGFSDLTVVLFAYYDFKRALLCIEDELVFKGKSGIDVARDTMKKRHELWGIAKTPRAQIADVSLQVVADMAQATINDRIAGQSAMCVWGAVEKTDADAALNTARAMISERRVRIDPRCVTLIDHLSNGVWANGRKTTFDRSAAYGHFDAIDAFKYLVRHVDWKRNPTPSMHGLSYETHHIPRAVPEQARVQPLVQRTRR